MKIAALLLAAGACAAAAESERALEAARTRGDAREQQWLYRDTLGSGDTEPTAVFLSWNYGAVIFRATCDGRTAELVLTYALEEDWRLPAVHPMEIISPAGTVRLRTVRAGNMLEGRAAVSPELRRVLRSPGDLQLVAPNEMEEPWHVGRAEPLRRLAKRCGSLRGKSR